MKRMIGVLALVGLFALGACTQAQTDSFVASISNFNRGVAAVDSAIQQISTTLYSNCISVQSVGQAAVDITGTCTKASPVIDSANILINNFCKANQVTNISSAITVTAAGISSVKSQLSAAKSACATGG